MTALRARAAGFALLVWAFYLGAQVGSEPPERGWVVTATEAACEEARHGVSELARAWETTVELGDCRDLSPDDLRRDPAAAAPSDPASPAGPDRAPQAAAPGRRPSDVRCLSRDACAERF
jgi:hypothetical protein